MIAAGFLESLRAYQKVQESFSLPDARNQIELVDRFLKLAESGAASLDRDHWDGHFTGSGLVTDETLDRVLLTLHQKLGRWLQLGGHADGDGDLSRVALRECQEESGVENLRFFRMNDVFEFGFPPIFDLDIHWIPPRKQEPGHYHYDVRYLVQMSSSEVPRISAESKELRWVPLTQAYTLSEEWSMHRQFDKLRIIRGKYDERNRPLF